MIQMKALVDNREKREMIKPSHVYSASFDMSDLSEKILRLQRELEERCHRDERTIVELSKHNRELQDELETLQSFDRKTSASSSFTYHLKNRTLSAQPRISFRSLLPNVRESFSRHNSGNPGILFTLRRTTPNVDHDVMAMANQIKEQRSGSSTYAS